MFRDVVDRFVEDHCGREYVRARDQAREYPHAAYDKIVEQGWLGLTMPEEQGGIGADLMYRVILQEGLSRHGFDMGAAYGVTAWGIETLLRFGSAAQRAEYIPRALDGRIRFSISMSEPDAGSDLSSIGLRAADMGDHFLLNGQKLWASFAGARDNVIVLAARTSRHEKDRRAGLTMMLVPNDAPGLELRRLNTLSRRMSGTYECFYTDVRVPKDNVVGRIDHGWDILAAFLVEERVGGAAMYVGQTRDGARRRRALRPHPKAVRPRHRRVPGDQAWLGRRGRRTRGGPPADLSSRLAGQPRRRRPQIPPPRPSSTPARPGYASPPWGCRSSAATRSSRSSTWNATGATPSRAPSAPARRRSSAPSWARRWGCRHTTPLKV